MKMYMVIVPICILFWFFVKHLLHLYHTECYVKHLKSTYPLVPVFGTSYGMIGKTTSQIYERFLQFSKTNETPTKEYLGDILIIMIDKPEDMKTICTSPLCLDKPFIYDFLPYQHSVFSTRSTAAWKSIRRHLNPAFSIKILQSFLPIFNEKANFMLNKLENEVGRGEFNILPHIQWETLDSICATIMKFDLNSCSYRTNKYFEATDAFFNLISTRFIQPWLHKDFIYKRTKLYKQEQQCFSTFQPLINSIYADADKNCNKNIDPSEMKSRILIDRLLHLRSDGELEEDSIKEQIETILVAGNDTTATTISFAILMLAIHPEIQNRVYDELQSIFRKENEEILEQHLNRLHYLDLVLKETMRLFPAGAYPQRSAMADISISNCTIPKGTVIVLSIFSLHRREDIWGKGANEFNPDNFLPENVKKRHPFAFVPFSAGQRNCIGHRYAMISMKSLLASMLRRFKFSSSMKMCDIDLKFEMVLKSGNEHLVQIERR